MSKLLQYINVLDKDAIVRAAHAADPVTCASNFGLTKLEQDAFQSGDSQRIADAIGIPNQHISTLHIPLSLPIGPRLAF